MLYEGYSGWVIVSLEDAYLDWHNLTLVITKKAVVTWNDTFYIKNENLRPYEEDLQLFEILADSQWIK